MQLSGQPTSAQLRGSRSVNTLATFAVLPTGADAHMISRHPSVSIISNLDENGRPVLDNGGLGSYEVVWHTDNSYVEVPPAGSMLYALEIPPAEGGGDTSFNN